MPEARRWLNIRQAAAAYPGVFTERLLKRLAEERRVPFSYAGRQRVFLEADLEAYLEGNRVEPPRTRSRASA